MYDVCSIVNGFAIISKKRVKFEQYSGNSLDSLRTGVNSKNCKRALPSRIHTPQRDKSRHRDGLKPHRNSGGHEGFDR
jgi:hypothetical protein